MDANRAGLACGEDGDEPERRHFIELARAAGAMVVDLTPVFRAHFERSSLSLDIGPGDGHFNAIGVQLVAQQAARALGP